MNENELELPEMILLEHFSGDFKRFIDAVYMVFQHEFVNHKTRFRGEELRLKWHPVYQDKSYTFYHMTHKGEDEQNREPDLRRCERIPWARPIIENCDQWNLKIWPQKRKGSS